MTKYAHSYDHRKIISEPSVRAPGLSIERWWRTIGSPATLYPVGWEIWFALCCHETSTFNGTRWTSSVIRRSYEPALGDPRLQSIATRPISHALAWVFMEPSRPVRFSRVVLQGSSPYTSWRLTCACLQIRMVGVYQPFTKVHSLCYALWSFISLLCRRHRSFVPGSFPTFRAWTLMESRKPAKPKITQVPSYEQRLLFITISAGLLQTDIWIAHSSFLDDPHPYILSCQEDSGSRSIIETSMR